MTELRMNEVLEVLSLANETYQMDAKLSSDFKTFVKSRMLTNESIQKFQIGHAVNHGILLKYLSYLQQDIFIQLGLDLYRNRITFPIHDHEGIVKGFISRAAKEGLAPKYLKSKEPFVLDHDQILYSYFLAKDAIKEMNRVIIVEGNMDVIMMHQHGFHETIGTMGRALSESSIDLLLKSTSNIILGQNSDAGGQMATSKISEQFLRRGITPKVLDFSPARDADEFLLKLGRNKLIDRIML